jgi:hypothetical protein
MKAIIKLTNSNHEEILIGVAQIIRVEHVNTSGLTKIQSVGAMVTTSFVLQTVEEIYEQINNN